MKILIYLFTFIAVIPVIVLPQSSSKGAGTASALFLRSSISARVSGLSDAFTALADDENAIFYNPAGLVNLDRITFSLNHTEWLEDIRFDNFVFAHSFNSSFSTGITFSHMWMPALKGFDISGNPTSDINISSSIIGIAAAYKFAKGFQSGLTFKFASDNLDGSSANGIAFDFGTLWNTPLSGFSTGFSVNNIAGKMKYDKSEYDLPFNYRVGIAYKVRPIPLVIALDGVKSIDTDIFINFGSEYTILKKYSLQVGNQYRKDSPFTPSFGIGGQITDQIKLYYSFSSPSEIGFSNRFGLKFEFGKPYSKFDVPKFVKTKSLSSTLLPPDGLNAQILNGNLIISWQESAKGTLYNVYAKNSAGNWTKLTQTPLSDNFLVLKNPVQNKTYNFSVTKVMGSDESAYSKEVSINVK